MENNETQNQMQNQDVPVTPPIETPSPQEESGSSIGAIVAICIIIAIVVVGALYAWGARLERDAAENANAEAMLDAYYEQEKEREDYETEMLRAQSQSTDIGSIEADLETTDFSSIEADLDALDAELRL